jgi:hypothetical protein
VFPSTGKNTILYAITIVVFVGEIAIVKVGEDLNAVDVADVRV